MISSFFSILSAIVSLGTASSVVLHDTRLDKAAAAAIATPVAYASHEGARPIFTGESHTHVERSNFSQVMHAYQSVAPGIQPPDEGFLRQGVIQHGRIGLACQYTEMGQVGGNGKIAVHLQFKQMQYQDIPGFGPFHEKGTGLMIHLW